jgi:hypothetical protein
MVIDAHPVASAPFKALMCFCLSPLGRRNSSHQLCGWSLTSKPHLRPNSYVANGSAELVAGLFKMLTEESELKLKVI